ncbi:hypothetical protein JNB62_02520 [Microbacterium jejuense]|uniref:Uncharacterized protein n=1 Tax=Microbacterium jejuense TaxID=1263637 RepID=A0ABS7HIB9_9MICO|nr:hypothetical protein [Microbacterium jejuense]MBW9092553.1 hypothetical protein [Microbacterium jejuense]
MSHETPVADTETFLRELLIRTAAAHGVHERDDLGGVYDEDWPRWYAAYMARDLAAAGHAIVRSEP